MVVKAALLIVFFAIMVCVGLVCRKRATDVNQFVLGGRSVGPWLTAFAYGTSYFSAVIFVGYAGQFGWKYGVSATWIGIGNALIGTLLAWVVLGKRTRLMTHHLETKTMPEFFEKRFNSKGLKMFASLIIFVFLIPYTASLYNGLSRLFGMAFNIDYSFCVIIMAILTAIYVIAGGYMATAINDFIQGIIMLGGIVAVIVSVLNQNGGFTEALKTMSTVTDSANNVQAGEFTALFGPDPLNLFGVVILTSLGTWGLPQMVHKFYAIKDQKAVKIGTVISTLFAVVVAGGCYFLGGFGRLYDSVDIAKGYDQIIPTMLSGLSDVLIGIVVILVLSASMSTLSSLVLTSSSTLTLDFIKGTVVKDMKEKTQLFVMRIFIFVFILISVVIAIVQYKSNVTFIAQLMGVSWGALAGSFLAPFLYGLFWKRVNKVAIYSCFVFGSGFIIVNMLFKDIFPTILQSPINAGAFVMLAGMILVPVVSLLTGKPDQETTENAFACLENNEQSTKKAFAHLEVSEN